MSDYSSIFVHSSCVSKAQLLAYIQQQMDKEEMFLIESHLNDCQFCNDALDGLLDADFVQVEKDINNAKNEISKKLFPVLQVEHAQKPDNSKVKDFEISKKTFTRWLAAASVLLLIGLGGYSVFSYIKSQKNELSLNKKVPLDKSYDAKYSKDESAYDEIVKIKVEDNDTFKNYAEEKSTSPIKKIPDVAPAPRSIAIIADKKPDDEKAINKEVSDAPEEKKVAEIASAPAKVNHAENDVIDAAPGMDNYAGANKNEKPSAPLQREVLKKKSGGGMKNDNLGNAQTTQLTYPKAATNNNLERNIEQAAVKQQEASDAEQGNERTNFAQGMDYFNDKNYRKSISYFEKALKKAVGTEREDIMYHLALAYDNIGKNEKATELYAALSKSKKYSVDADRKLQESQGRNETKKK